VSQRRAVAEQRPPGLGAQLSGLFVCGVLDITAPSSCMASLDFDPSLLQDCCPALAGTTSLRRRDWQLRCSGCCVISSSRIQRPLSSRVGDSPASNSSVSNAGFSGVLYGVGWLFLHDPRRGAFVGGRRYPFFFQMMGDRRWSSTCSASGFPSRSSCGGSHPRYFTVINASPYERGESSNSPCA